MVKTIRIFKAYWDCLSIKRRRQLWLLMVFAAFTSIFESLSFGTLIPFLAVLSDPNFIQEFLQEYQITPLLDLSNQILVILFSAVFIISTSISAFVRVANLKLNASLSASIGTDLSDLAYKKIIGQPYSFFQRVNSADLIDKIVNQVDLIVVAIYSLLQIISSAAVLIGLFLSFFIVNPKLTIFCILLFLVFYISMAFCTKGLMKSNGIKYVESSSRQIRLLQEGFGSIRDVILDGNQNILVNTFSSVNYSKRKAQAENQFLSSFPKFTFEALGMIIIAVIGLSYALNNQNALVLPTLGAMALGAQRLLPASQQLYAGWTLINSNRKPMENIIELLNLELPEVLTSHNSLRFRDSIELLNLSYKYTDKDDYYLLKSINLKIKKGEKIGLIGPTGSGKSTLVDIIMGLLVPSNGNFFIDNNDLYIDNNSSQLFSWRSNISHVPQSIFMSDDSILNNIAFGVDRQNIDLDRVKCSARLACISEYIESLPDSYYTIVGENGLRLSGGQRQRIGIARALYKSSELLVLDEATSALDANTEQQVMSSIYTYNPDITLIIIAHRLSTLNLCDKIYKLESGCLSQM